MKHHSVRSKKIFYSFLLTSFLSGCASHIDNAEIDSPDEVNDPLEPLNRCVHYLNMGLDFAIVKPLAYVYRWTTPEALRSGITNFYTNLGAPINFANHLLQGRPEDAGNTIIRFVTNSTQGILGFFDPATEFGFPLKETGFNDTLNVWGINTGPYLVLPLFGPSSFRGSVGLVGDYYLQPYNHYFMNSSHNDDWISWTLTGVDVVRQREALIETIDDLVANSLDTYVTFRSIYFQKQAYRVTELNSNVGCAEEK